jgi:integrin beta 3
VGIADVDEPEDDDVGRDRLADRLGWLRHGWIGPLVIALVLSLLAVGVYAVLSRGKGGGSPSVSPTPSVSTTPTPKTTNPDALTGAALVDGTYDCWHMNPRAKENNAVLVVPRSRGSYLWNGQSGQYTVMRQPWGDNPGTVVTTVTFTTGPLGRLTARGVATVGAGIGGKARFVLLFNGVDRYCTVN